MGRPGVHIGAAVDQKGNSLFRRDQGRKGRPLHSFDPADDHLAADQNRSGAAGGNESVRLSVLYQIQSHNNRGILFLPDRVYRRFPRFDHLRRFPDLDLGLIICIVCKLFFDIGRSSRKDHRDILPLIDRLDRALYDLSRRIVASHGVNRNFYH